MQTVVLSTWDMYIGKMMSILGEGCRGWDCQGRWNGEGPKMRYMDAVREVMAVVEVTEEDAKNKTKRRWKMHCGDTRWEKPEEEDRWTTNTRPAHKTVELTKPIAETMEFTTCHPETPFVVWPCDEKRRHERSKASNNDEGGREETSRKAQTEVDGPSAERFQTTPARTKARTEPRSMEKGSRGDRQRRALSSQRRLKLVSGTRTKLVLSHTKPWAYQRNFITLIFAKYFGNTKSWNYNRMDIWNR